MGAFADLERSMRMAATVVDTDSKRRESWARRTAVTGNFNFNFFLQ